MCDIFLKKTASVLLLTFFAGSSHDLAAARCDTFSSSTESNNENLCKTIKSNANHFACALLPRGACVTVCHTHDTDEHDCKANPACVWVSQGLETHPCKEKLHGWTPIN